MARNREYEDVPNLEKTYEIWTRSLTSHAWSKVDAPDFSSLGAAVAWSKLQLSEKFRNIAIYRADRTLSWGSWWDKY